MTIGVWGDSITYGSCDSEALGWVGRLRKSLPSDDWHELYNFGICGDTTEDLLRRFSIEARAIKSTHVIFAIGINDSKFPQGDANLVPLAEYKTNLIQLVSQGREFTDAIAIVSATCVADEAASWPKNRFHNKTIEEYNTAMAAVAKEQNVQFVDVFSVIDPETDLADGLHPNAEGYQKLFAYIEPKLNLS